MTLMGLLGNKTPAQLKSLLIKLEALMIPRIFKYIYVNEETFSQRNISNIEATGICDCDPCILRFYPEIFNASGCWDNVRKYGDWFTYDKSPRALIFKRDNVKVKDLASMQQLMR